jgi:hypothetical protein
MQVISYVVYAIAALLTATFLLGIRTHTASGTGVTNQSVNTTFLFIVSLAVIPVGSLSPLHLLWMFLLSWVLGTLSLAFPFSLLSIPGRLVFHLACIGLDAAEIQLRRERFKKFQSLMIQKGVTAKQAREELQARGEW